MGMGVLIAGGDSCARAEMCCCCWPLHENPPESGFWRKRGKSVCLFLSWCGDDLGSLDISYPPWAGCVVGMQLSRGHKRCAIRWDMMHAIPCQAGCFGKLLGFWALPQQRDSSQTAFVRLAFAGQETDLGPGVLKRPVLV